MSSADGSVTADGVALLRHAELHYTDWQISRDIDCLLSCAATKGDRKLLKRYANLRRAAPDYRPSSVPAGSNHNSVDPRLLAELHRMTALDSDQPLPGVECVVCGHRFQARRGARTCSLRCRKRLSRHTYQPKNTALVGKGANDESRLATRVRAASSSSGEVVAA